MANSYLSRTSGTATNTDICTLSVWIKRSKLSGNDEIIIGDICRAPAGALQISTQVERKCIQ